MKRKKDVSLQVAFLVFSVIFGAISVWVASHEVGGIKVLAIAGVVFFGVNVWIWGGASLFGFVYGSSAGEREEFYADREAWYLENLPETYPYIEDWDEEAIALRVAPRHTLFMSFEDPRRRKDWLVHPAAYARKVGDEYVGDSHRSVAHMRDANGRIVIDTD